MITDVLALLRQILPVGLCQLPVQKKSNSMREGIETHAKATVL